MPNPCRARPLRLVIVQGASQTWPNAVMIPAVYTCTRGTYIHAYKTTQDFDVVNPKPGEPLVNFAAPVAERRVMYYLEVNENPPTDVVDLYGDDLSWLSGFVYFSERHRDLIGEPSGDWLDYLVQGRKNFAIFMAKKLRIKRESDAEATETEDTEEDTEEEEDEDEEPPIFECTKCHERFEHRMYHTFHVCPSAEVKPYQCPCCEQNFKRESSYRAHLIRAHQKYLQS